MSMEVEIIGGPMNGQVWATQDNATNLSFVTLDEPLASLWNGAATDPASIHHVPMTTFNCPIRRTFNGRAVVFWDERMSS